jgi:hypothetical protein
VSPARVQDELDPFDLPDWVGEKALAWAAGRGLSGHLVAGHLASDDGDDLPFDLLAVDQAYPVPVVDELTRTAAHRAWRHGQVLLLSRDGRATVAVPGTSFAADRVLDVLTRVARAVGADPGRWSVRLTLG